MATKPIRETRGQQTGESLTPLQTTATTETCIGRRPTPTQTKEEESPTPTGIKVPTDRTPTPLLLHVETTLKINGEETTDPGKEGANSADKEQGPLQIPRAFTSSEAQRSN